jgi:hypothetical protein
MPAERGAQFWFHGSDVDFNDGDIITPQNYGHAFATTDHTLAKEYGKNVYRVTPVDPKEAADYTAEDNLKWVGPIPKTHGPDVIMKSQKGYRVVKKHGDRVKKSKDA